MRLFLVLVPVLGAAAMAADVAQRYGSFPIIADGLSPRYFLDRSLPLAKRDGNCGDDRHPCKSTPPPTSIRVTYMPD